MVTVAAEFDPRVAPFGLLNVTWNVSLCSRIASSVTGTVMTLLVSFGAKVTSAEVFV
jgi:hypothetical protein